MAFAPRGNTVVFPAAQAFSARAVHLGAGFQVLVENGSNSVAWVFFAATEAEANAAVLPADGAPTAAFAVQPGQSRVVQHILGTSNQGIWANVATPTDADATNLVSLTPGSGEQ